MVFLLVYTSYPTMIYLLFIIWFIILIKGADLLVDGASSIAKKLKISDLIIGLTIVAFGTSAPELVVNVSASLSGATGITIGNIVGSNIANILLILWISAIIYPLHMKKEILSREAIFTVIATLIFAIFINDTFIDWGVNLVTRSEGLLLITLLGIFLYYLFANSKNQKDASSEEIKTLSRGKSIAWVVFGLAGLILWGEWIVNGAIEIAQHFGISERIIGLTIIAIGTSLPELATSAVAAYKKNTDLAIGNVLGSNLLNILFILGVSSLITPIPAIVGTNTDLLVLVVATALIFFFAMGRGFRGKKYQISRIDGIMMVVIYGGYVAYLIFGSLA